jgi:hypothetical protein
MQLADMFQMAPDARAGSECNAATRPMLRVINGGLGR